MNRQRICISRVGHVRVWFLQSTHREKTPWCYQTNTTVSTWRSVLVVVITSSCGCSGIHQLSPGTTHERTQGILRIWRSRLEYLFLSLMRRSKCWSTYRWIVRRPEKRVKEVWSSFCSLTFLLEKDESVGKTQNSNNPWAQCIDV